MCRASIIAAFALQLPLLAGAQQAVELPVATALSAEKAQAFQFASDGPIGPGWTRPDQIARVYFPEGLPALFRRTIELDRDVPGKSRLSWIFTGPHAGFTIDLTSSTVRLYEREYASNGLRAPGEGEHILRDEERTYVGHPRSLTVVVDAHLAVSVILNGQPILSQTLTFDLTRHQLMFSGPRHDHLILGGALLKERPAQSTITVSPGKQHQSILGFGGSPSIPAYAACPPC